MTIDYTDRGAIPVEMCVDCAMLLSNGEADRIEPSWCPTNCPECRNGSSCIGAHDAFVDAIEAIWPADTWSVFHDSGDDCGESFSWSPCDVCGSRLGGSRHTGAAVRK